MIAGAQQRDDGANGRHAGREGEALTSVLDRRDVALEREARRVLRARVLESLVLAELVLHVGGGQVQGGHDGAGDRVRALACVDGPGGQATSEVFASKDRGATWTPRATIHGQFWSTLFVHRGALYLIGTDKHHGNAIIRRSTDGGATWTAACEVAVTVTV